MGSGASLKRTRPTGHIHGQHKTPFPGTPNQASRKRCNEAMPICLSRLSIPSGPPNDMARFLRGQIEMKPFGDRPRPGIAASPTMPISIAIRRQWQWLIHGQIVSPVPVLLPALGSEQPAASSQNRKTTATTALHPTALSPAPRPPLIEASPFTFRPESSVDGPSSSPCHGAWPVDLPVPPLGTCRAQRKHRDVGQSPN